MSAVKPRRSEYVEQTRAALLDAAEALFAEKGFAATSLAAVAEAARFTKGAVYGHFPDKESLFVAVFERVQTTALAPLMSVDADAVGPPDVMAMVVGFLDICAEPRYRTIVLEQGPVALGATRWRELDHLYAGRILEELLASLIDEGIIAPAPVDVLSRLCCSLAGEAALLIAGSDDPTETRQQSIQILATMFSGLLSSR